MEITWAWHTNEEINLLGACCAVTLGSLVKEPISKPNDQLSLIFRTSPLKPDDGTGGAADPKPAGT